MTAIADRPSPVTIMPVDRAGLDARLDEFAAVLHACVHAGASVSFVLPFERSDAAAFWAGKVAPMLAADGVLLLAALVDGRVAGTAQLDLATPPNQPHRAEVRKVLVHPDHRRRGIARALMLALEDRARAAGRWLLTLDTGTGGSGEALYAGLGYEAVGVIPAYSIDPHDPARFDGTTIMFKRLMPTSGLGEVGMR